MRLASLRLREKLAAPFVGLALITAICGGVGLLAVHRISGTVSVLADVTSPLLMESMALTSNAQEMRSTFLAGTTQSAVKREEVQASLSRLELDSAQHIERARSLAAKVAMSAELDQVANLQSEFATTLKQMTDAYGRARRAEALVAERVVLVDAALKATETVLYDLMGRMEAKLVENEEAAKVRIQTGHASVDDIGGLFAQTVTEVFPIVQSTSRLLRAAVGFHHSVQEILRIADERALIALDEETKRQFGSVSSILRKMDSRLRSSQQGPAVATASRSLDTLADLLVGANNGLVAAKRDSLNAAAAIALGTANLDRIGALHLALLKDLEVAVRAQNYASKVDAERAVKSGLTGIGALVLVAAVFAFAAAVFLNRRILVPVSRITAHVDAIGKTGDLTPMTDPATVRARDEFGDLARAFNRMMAELVEVRRQLIERSDAELARQVERLEAALSNMSQGLAMFDKERKIVISNDRYSRLYGLSPDQVKPGTPLAQIIENRIASGVKDPDKYRLDQMAGVEAPSDYIYELSDGRVVAVTRRPMASGGWVATHEDISERRKVEARIAHLAHHDVLTDLPNRALLRTRLLEALGTLTKDNRRLAVLMLDLDRFKEVNDTLGHAIGDQLLKVVTQRLYGCVRETDTIARLGGDEFAVVQSVADATIETTALAQRILEAVAAPFDLDGHHVVVGASVGVSVAPGDGTDPDELLKNADLALYRAKSEGRGTYRFFEPEMDRRMQARRGLERDLRNAIKNGELVLHYQPIVNLERDEICGLEVLLRWNHPEKGELQPADFIPLAEETGVIVSIGEWVLKKACSDAAKWPPHLRISVNISPVQFKARNLFEVVVNTLAASGVSAQRLELEITESVMLQDGDTAFEVLTRLHDLGVRIALDDFGTGYSSLSLLRKFPFDKIKIDRSFISDLSSASIDALAVVRSVAQLGVSLGMSTTAEGVETKEQLDQVRAEGCTEMQGFYWCRPKPFEQIAALFLVDAHKPASAA